MDQLPRPDQCCSIGGLKLRGCADRRAERRIRRGAVTARCRYYVLRDREFRDGFDAYARSWFEVPRLPRERQYLTGTAVWTAFLLVPAAFLHGVEVDKVEPKVASALPSRGISGDIRVDGEGSNRGEPFGPVSRDRIVAAGRRDHLCCRRRRVSCPRPLPLYGPGSSLRYPPEVVPFVVEFEVAVPRLTPAFW